MHKFNIFDATSDVNLLTVTDLQGPRELARVLDMPLMGFTSDRARGEAALVIADLTGGSITLRQANRHLGRLFDLAIEVL